MSLGSNEEAMPRCFDELNQTTIRRCTGDDQSAVINIAEESSVDFIAMTMTFGHRSRTVDLSYLTAGDQFSRVITQAHCAAGRFFTLLIIHDVDDVIS